MPLDAHGNTISKADAEAKKRLDAERAAARARREAKTALAAAFAADPPAAPVKEKKSKKEKKPTAKEEEELERIKKKMETESLTSKEKRLLKKFGQSQVAEVVQETEPELPKYFDPAVKVTIERTSRSGTGTAGNGDGDNDDDEVSANSSKKSPPSVFVDSFSVEAGERSLLANATLRLVGGKRYGLLGANGCGKSTILRLLAGGRLPVPPRMKVILVEQEVEALETMSVTEQVLAADTERASLLTQEKALTAELEAAEAKDTEAEVSEDSGGWDADTWLSKITNLEEVSAALEACGGWAAEGVVARILAGLGFTPAMAAAPSAKLSGGWRMRVALARALFLTSSSMGQDLLLLDEPTNHLDLV